MKPNTWLDTLLRRLSRFGDVGPLRRAMERWGLVKREETLTEFVRRHHAAGHKVTVHLDSFSSGLWSEPSKQDPAVWDAADRARRESE